MRARTGFYAFELYWVFRSNNGFARVKRPNANFNDCNFMVIYRENNYIGPSILIRSKFSFRKYHFSTYLNFNFVSTF